VRLRTSSPSIESLLSQSSHNAITVIEYVIVHRDNKMQCDSMPLWHPQGTISDWRQNYHDVHDKDPFIPCYEDSPVITDCWILEAIVGEFSESVGLLKQLPCQVPTCCHIPNWLFCNADCGCLTVNELVLTTSCQRNQYSKHPLLYEG